MLQIIRNNNPLTVLILCIYGLAVNWSVLFHPELPVVHEGDFFFFIVTGFLKVVLFNSAFGFTLLSVVMLVLQSLYLNAVANRHKLFRKPTYIVAFIYLSLTGLYPYFGYYSQALLVNWLIIMLVDIVLQLPQSHKPRMQIYNAGFVAGMAALLVFPAVAYIVMLLIAVSLLRNFNPGEWVVAILGWLTPMYFAAGLLFLFDKLHWMPQWINLGFNLPSRLLHPVYMITVVAGIIILFAMGVYALQKQLLRVSIFVRRGWTVLALCVLVSCLVAILMDFDIRMAWLVVMPSLSLVIANAYYAEKNKAFSNFAFYFTLLLVIFCNIANS